MNNAAEKAGLKTDGGSTLSQMLTAGFNVADYWERRAKRLGLVISNLLASDDLPPAFRERVNAALVGPLKAPSADLKLLSETEQRLIRQYRAMDVPARQLVRTLFDRLGRSPSVEE
jgi:hypothetical protein